MPAVRPRLSPVHFSFGGRLAERITELSVTLNTSAPHLNLGLITAEFRAVARDQVPGARTPARTLRFPLCDCDPLFGKIHDPGVVRVGPVQMVINTELGIRFLLDVKVSTTHATRFGYDLLVRRARLPARPAPAPGTCHFAGILQLQGGPFLGDAEMTGSRRLRSDVHRSLHKVSAAATAHVRGGRREHRRLDAERHRR